MNMALYSRDFTGTGIKTPFDQMRANAIINANHDTRGMSIISFNINAFMQQARKDELYYILSLWAIEPINRSPDRFKKYPKAGIKALHKRAKALRDNFYKTRNVPDWFTDAAFEHMSIAIDNEMSLIKPDIKETNMRFA